MKRFTQLLFAALAAILLAPSGLRAETSKLRVVGTQSTYASIADFIGGDRVVVDYIVRGDQDPHFVRPRPSLAQKLTKADLFISTGLDLELWAPALIDMSRNEEIRSGQRRYVSAAAGVRLQEIPKTRSRSEGGVHIYGNPHITPNPLNGKVIAKNIASGLARIDPDGAGLYQKNYQRFCDEIDRRLYGEELLQLIGAATLNRLAEHPDRLIRFLQNKSYKGTPLIDRLGGWLKQGMAFRGKKIIGYHKNWAYANALFGLQMRNYVEPRPSIPPSPRHIEAVIKQMQQEKIGVILAANYYDESRVRAIAERVGARAVIVPIGVYGAEGVDDYFAVIDSFVDQLAAAYQAQGA